MHHLGAPRPGSGARTAPVPFAPPQRRSRLARWFDNLMRSLGMALVLFLIIRTFLVEAFQIPSGSMERTLLAGDFLFVNKAVYGAQIPGTHARLPGFESPRRGDVIVFAYPKNPELNYVKRVIGAPGDTVEMRSGVVRVNGRRLMEPYVQRVDPATCTIRSSTGSGTICSAPRGWSATITPPGTPGVPWPSRSPSTSSWATTETTPRIPGTGASWTRPRSRDGRSSCISVTTGRRGMRFPG